MRFRIVTCRSRSHYTEGFGADQTSRHELGGKVSIALHKRIRPSFEYVQERYIQRHPRAVVHLCHGCAGDAVVWACWAS